MTALARTALLTRTELLTRPVFVGRGVETAAALSAIEADDSAGVVLVGGEGMGKTALLQELVAQLSPWTKVIRIRGSEATADAPYSSLISLLAELDPAGLGHPVHLIQNVTQLVTSLSEGRPAVLAVDNAELLDVRSAAVIAQLAASRTARLLLTTSSLAQTDPAFMRLWREGSLRRVDLGQFSLSETTAFVESELGGYASSEVIRAVLEGSGGVPRLIQEVTHELVRVGRVRQDNASWIFDGLPQVTTGSKIGVSVSELRPAPIGSAPQHIAAVPEMPRAAHFLALSGGLPQRLLFSLVDSIDVDILQRSGLVTVARDAHATVTCTTQMFSRSSREEISSSEARRLYELMSSVADESEIRSLNPAAHASWLMSAGLDVGPELAVRAAHAANDTGDHELALTVCHHGRHPAEDEALAAEALRALLALGDVSSAQQLVKDLPLSSPTQRTSRVSGSAVAGRVLLNLRRSELSQRQGHGPLSPLLDEAETLLDGAETQPPLESGMVELHRGESAGDQIAELREELLIARAETAAFDGAYAEVERLLAGQIESPQRLGDDALVRMRTLLCESRTMTVRQEEAMELARGLVSFLERHTVTSRTRERALTQVWETHRLLGEVGVVARLRDRVLTTCPAGDLAPCSYEQISRALGYAHQGRVAEALAILGPTFDQLRISDPEHIMPAAAAGLSYCHATLRNLPDAISYLPLSEAGPESPWKVRRTARYFQLLAAAHTESRPAAAADLLAFAAEETERGGTVFALLAVCRAARLGDRRALDPLSSLSARLQGSFARLSETYAKGLASRDCELLLQTMEGAATMGDTLFAQEIGRTALQLAVQSPDKRFVKQVQRRVREVHPDLDEDGPLGARLDALTGREREIALAAAGGATNRDIARNLCVSVRTVEGHLYQVYSKLHVCTRAELTELLQPGQA